MSQIEDLGIKVDKLEISTRRLTVEVTNLGSALDQVRRLEDEQVELREQTTLAMFNALAAADQATQTNEAFTKAEKAHSDRDHRRMHVARLLLVGALLLLPIIAAFVYAAMLSRVRDLVTQTQQDLVSNCQLRNESLEVTIKRELRLSQADSPDTRQAHLDSATAYRDLVVDCQAKYGSSL